MINRRLRAMIVKEFFQLLRDYGTVITMIMIPFLEVVLFGLILNTDPKHLSTYVVSNDDSQFTRSLIKGLENTQYFNIAGYTDSDDEAANHMAQGKVQFILNIPQNFTRDLVRGNKPTLLLIADGANPLLISNAVDAAEKLIKTVFDYDLRGAVSDAKSDPQTVNLTVEQKYNPDAIPQYYSLPALVGVILSLTMVTMTSISITRERDQNTMESLLMTPIKPIEVMLGKLFPSVIIGYIQIFLVLMVSRWIFHVPFQGSVVLLLIIALPFIISCLGVGLVLSTIAKTQFHSVQLDAFYFLPSLLFSGFLFPFQGMPIWAQWIGNVLPLTHFLRISTGIITKGNGFLNVWNDVWPLLIFMIAMLTISVITFRNNLE